MKLNDQLKEILLGINETLPPEKRAEFARRIRERFKTLQIDDLAGYTIAGALVGAVCEALPLDTVTGVDDWVEVGAALGAAIGYAATGRTPLSKPTRSRSSTDSPTSCRIRSWRR